MDTDGTPIAKVFCAASTFNLVGCKHRTDPVYIHHSVEPVSFITTSLTNDSDALVDIQMLYWRTLCCVDD